MTIVEEIRSLLKVFCGLSCCHLALCQSVHPSTGANQGTIAHTVQHSIGMLLCSSEEYVQRVEEHSSIGCPDGVRVVVEVLLQSTRSAKAEALMDLSQPNMLHPRL